MEVSTRARTKRGEDANNSAEKANCEMKWTTQAHWKNMPLLFENSKKRTCIYNLLFPAEINTSDSETPTTYIPFHTDYRGRLLINIDFFLQSSLYNIK